MEYTALESFILARISRHKIPGLSIALLKNGEIVYARGFGFKDVESAQPPTPRTNYCIGSVTKAFTALAIMQLQEKGLLSVEDPVNKYVGVVKSSDIKIHHLLTHTSGIPALGYAEALIEGYYELGGTWLPISSPDDVLAYMSDYESWHVFKPGERWFYLNEGYVILGKIIEKVSGLEYEEYLKKHVFEKLGMDKSYFGREEYLRDADKATPYKATPEGRLVRAEPLFGIKADGGLFSNVLDLLKFAEMMVSRGIFRGVEVVREESIELMERSHVKLPYESPTSRYYGYGLVIHDDFHGKKLVGHSGSVYVYSAYLGYVPSDKIAVAVLANTSTYPLSLIGAYALTMLMGLRPEEALPFIKYESLLEAIKGSYVGYRGSIRLNVKTSDGAVIIENPARKTLLPAFPARIEEGYALFYVQGLAAKIPVEFYIEKDRVVMIYERYVMQKAG